MNIQGFGVIDGKTESEFRSCIKVVDRISVRTGIFMFEIKCVLGFWGVECASYDAALMEAFYYWQQYKADGEYYKIIGGDSPTEVLLKGESK